MRMRTMALTGRGDNMLDVFAFQDFCSQGNQGDGS